MVIHTVSLLFMITIRESLSYFEKKIDYLKGINFHGKKILRIWWFLLKSTKLNRS